MELINWRAIRVAVAFLICTWWIAESHASINCGIKPIIPVGCSDAVCVCDDNGNCYWVYVCD